MPNTMTPAQQQAAAIEAVLARQKEDAKNPKTGGPAPEMPVFGGTPNVSPSDKAKYAAEIARKTPQIVPSTRRIQEQPQASTQSQANVMRDYYASRQRAAQAQPTPNKPVLPTPKPISPPVTPIAPKPMPPKVVPRPSTGVPDLDSPYPLAPYPTPKPFSGPIPDTNFVPPKPPKIVAPEPTPTLSPTEPESPSYFDYKKGGSVKGYTDKSGRINLGSGRVSTHTPSKKNSNW